MHSFSHCLMHAVFATKHRLPVLSPAICQRLYPYLGGIARDHGMRALAVGGVADHVHVLLSLPATLALAKAMQLVKGNSSKWLNETFAEIRPFAWQEGYATFSVGASGVPATEAYIRNQVEHHRVRTFRDEVETFLRRHGVAFEASMLD